MSPDKTGVLRIKEFVAMNGQAFSRTVAPLRRGRIGLISMCILTFAFANSLVAQKIRIATFNTSLYRNKSGELAKEFETKDSSQARKVAEIIQTVRPDIVLLNEFDFDNEGKAAQEFQKHFLSNSWNGKQKIEYGFRYVPPVNTGVASGLDLDSDGKSDGPGDAFGFGKHPGQYGFVILSRFPIRTKEIRTFQKFLWKDMPGAKLPKNKDGSDYYSNAAKNVLRLSSKTHCDVPIEIKGQTIHLLAAHPTPPVFDGEEDRNGKRNHDEIRFWSDYIIPERAEYIYDDRGKRGGLDRTDSFVIVGDLNADPNDGDSTDSPIKLFATNPRINFDVKPRSSGAVEASRKGTANQKHLGDAALDTADFNDFTVGNLRIDYVLPSNDLNVKTSGVFWPPSDHADAELVKVSDHRLVWIDVDLKQ